MANTVTGPTNQFDGDKKLIVYASVLSDGSASSSTLVDVSALNTNPEGESCAHVSLNKIWYSVGGGTDAPASLDWDATTDVTFLVVPSTSDAGNEYTVWCEFLKYYEAPGS